jgi:hypothetical protein
MSSDIPDWLKGVAAAKQVVDDNRSRLEEGVNSAKRVAENEELQKITNLENEVAGFLNVWKKFEVPQLLADIKFVLKADDIRPTIIKFKETLEYSLQEDGLFIENGMRREEYKFFKSIFLPTYFDRGQNIDSTHFSHIVGRVVNVKSSPCPPYEGGSYYYDVPLFAIFIHQFGWSVVTDQKKEFLGDQHIIKNPEILREQVGIFLTKAIF